MTLFLDAFTWTDRLTLFPVLLFVLSVFLVATRNIPARLSGRYAGSLISIILMFIVLGMIFYRFVVDDVFISLRYARNLAEGHGLVFSTDGSTPVEGYTNFLWVLLEAPLFMLNLPNETILHVIRVAGMLFGIGVIFIAYRMALLFTADLRWALVAAALCAAVPQFSFWAVGGLETPMYMFWMMCGLYLYFMENRKQQPHVWSVVCLILMALTRPEGLFFAAVLLFGDLFYSFTLGRDRENSASGKFAARALMAMITFAVLYGVYFIWRYNFYGHPLPNTFYAKKLSSAGYLYHRLRQVSAFFIPLLPFFALAVVGFAKTKNPQREKMLAALMMMLLLAFCFAARNEWMPGHRYEVPVVPLLMIFVTAGMQYLFSSKTNYTGRLALQGWTPGLITGLLGFFLLAQVKPLKNTGDEFAEKLYRAHVPLGKWLDKHAPDNASYASWDMGAVPYFSNLPHIIDINSEGLLNPYTTFHGYNIDHFLSSNPSFLVLPPDSSYVQPAEIRKFYSHEKVRNDYQFLFSIAFDKRYLLNVFRHKDVLLSEDAIQEGKRMAQQSFLDID